jgi:hypothetical protein
MAGLRLFTALAFVAPAAWVALGAHDAHACGGCFHPPPAREVASTVVTDHRMAFSMSLAQTVLWDQIRYSGSPTEFAWVLPVRQGARIELSHDSWIAALDASTAPVINGPSLNCPATGGGGGCGFPSSSDSTPSAAYAGGGDHSVQVVSQQVIGPYDAVTVRSTQGEALGDWLRTNGFDVSGAIQPTIDAYTVEGFDFIALKLRPGFGVQAMQPVRVVTAGADPTLPLRMVAAGVGARVGIVLFVLSEGRYHPKNFPDATIDWSRLAWDPNQQQSNYTTLVQQALTAATGTGWLTESAQPASMAVGAFGSFNPGLASAYETGCRTEVVAPMACATEAGAARGPAGAAEGGDAEAGDDAADGDVIGDAVVFDEGEGGGGGPDTGSEAGTCMAAPSCDDLAVAMTGIHGPLWVTRLRADLPASALASDLVLEATQSQTAVVNVHQTELYTIAGYAPACPKSGSCAAASIEARTRFADGGAFAVVSAALALALRRRRR